MPEPDGTGKPASGEERRVRVTRATPNLVVDDIEAASAFYTDYLGLSTEEFNLGWVARYTQPETGAHVQLVTRLKSRLVYYHHSIYYFIEESNIGIVRGNLNTIRSLNLSTI